MRPGSRQNVPRVSTLVVLLAAGIAFSASGDSPRLADITPKKPVEIRSQELTYERGSGLTRFSGDVVVTHGDLRMQADEVRATSGNRQATAEGHVMAVDPGMAATLTCGHLEYRDLMQVITAHDDPMLTSVDDELRPVTMKSRQMEFYSERKEAVANQGVVVTSAEGYAVADRATLLQEKGEILLEGEPRVFTTQGDFSGRRLRMNMRERRYEAEGGVEVNFYPTPQAKAPVPPVAGPGSGQGRGSAPPVDPSGAPVAVAPKTESKAVTTPVPGGTAPRSWGGGWGAGGR